MVHPHEPRRPCSSPRARSSPLREGSARAEREGAVQRNLPPRSGNGRERNAHGFVPRNGHSRLREGRAAVDRERGPVNRETGPSREGPDRSPLRPRRSEERNRSVSPPQEYPLQSRLRERRPSLRHQRGRNQRGPPHPDQRGVRGRSAPERLSRRKRRERDEQVGRSRREGERQVGLPPERDRGSPAGQEGGDGCGARRHGTGKSPPPVAPGPARSDRSLRAPPGRILCPVLARRCRSRTP